MLVVIKEKKSVLYLVMYIKDIIISIILFLDDKIRVFH